MSEICISNLVYGESYTNVFLNFHLKSLIENLASSTNFGRSYYFIFTEAANIAKIESHPNLQELKKYLNVHFFKIEGAVQYEARYQLQGLQVQNTVQFAVTNNLLLHIATADIYYGPKFFDSAFAQFEKGFDAIVHQPIRTTYECVAPLLGGNQPTVDELFDIGFNNPHPIWISENWDTPYFTKYPYQMIWADERSVCLRGFSLTPTIVVAQEWMTTAGGCTDITFLPHLKNPYYSNDWSELPMLELCHLFSFYPPFSNKRSNALEIATWAKSHTLPENFKNLTKYIIYKKTTDPINQDLIARSEVIAQEIISYGVAK